MFHKNNFLGKPGQSNFIYTLESSNIFKAFKTQKHAAHLKIKCRERKDSLKCIIRV